MVIPALASPPATRPEPKIKGKRIAVVTGAAGLVGQGLVAGLVEEGRYDIIRAIDVVSPRVLSDKVEAIRGNILDVEGLVRAFEGAETVFHVAALIHPREEAHRRQEIILVNVVGTQNVINAAVRCGVSKIIQTSSAGAVFDGRKGKNTERDYVEKPPVLDNVYATSKK